MTETAPLTGPRASFHAGRDCRAWEWAGAHRQGDAWRFSVWAPHAQRVSLTGEFNRWDREADPMAREEDGVWTLEVPVARFGVSPVLTYKYAILGQDGKWRFQGDPYAFRMEKQPGTAAVLWDVPKHEWKDAEWMTARKTWDPVKSPVNVYEVHLGSWRREGGNDRGRYLTYSEIADQLIPYALDMGYTHLELLPVMEHPFDGSWGYQVTGYFAATSRFGTPEELMQLIDRCHRAGLGVILDWVPAHFPKDEVGLRRFDGTPCYEHADERRSEMPQWGTTLFDYARGEVSSFLLSNAVYWLKEYHADGLRCDAVSCMLYLDFGRGPGYWLPNQYGGRENLDAIAFLRRMNETVYRECPGAITVAEESTAFPKVTDPTWEDGLGFGFKWNMGWMNDILSYVALDPIYRKYHHDKITFSMMYAFSENYILPFSHDEVVHGKHSMLDKQPGDHWRKFAGLRALYGYYMAHPGKKLLFMGGEFGQFVEWRDAEQLDWMLLGYENHARLQQYVKALNRLYREEPALHSVDDSWNGFQWLNVNDADRSIVAFLRMDGKGNAISAVTNFTPQPYGEYRLALPYPCELTEILNSDRAEFAGSGWQNPGPIRAENAPLNDLPCSATVCVPPLATVYYRVRKIED